MPDPSLDLAVPHDRGLDPARALTQDERRHLDAVRAEAASCDHVVVRMGGRAGRLGECVVATALLEGFLLALAALDKRRVPVRIAVDGPAAELFDASLYRDRHWPEIHMLALPAGYRVA